MIIGWYNNILRSYHAVDDYEGMSEIMPKHILRYMKRKESGDKRHSGTNVTATAALGCPRALLINRFLPTRPDPQKLWRMTGGTMLHKMMGDEVDNDVWYSEEHHPDKCTFVGDMWGVPVGVLLDLRNDDFSKIHDYKFSFSKGDLYAKNEASIHHTAQLSIGCHIIEQNGIKIPDDVELVAWVAGTTWKKTKATRMSLEEIGKVPIAQTKNSQGKFYTYKELFDDICFSMDEVSQLIKEYGSIDKVPAFAIEAVIHKMPMYGKTMWRNYKGLIMCDELCSVKKECYGIEGGL